MIPKNVLEDCTEKAQQMVGSGKPTSKAGYIVVVSIWILVIALAIWLLWKGFANN
jgi:hypothetical protein